MPLPYRVLFICWGNICRSPTAEAVLRRDVIDAGLSGQVEVDSAGVSGEHRGSPPDRRSQGEARRRGLDISGQRARRVSDDDWKRFDLLLVADDVVERTLLRQAPRRADRSKVARITDFLQADGPHADARATGEVPDPYYGDGDGFRDVFDLLEEASIGVLAQARTALAPEP